MTVGKQTLAPNSAVENPSAVLGMGKTVKEKLATGQYWVAQDVLHDPSFVVASLRHAGLGVIPTDTLYGLAMRIHDERALDRLFRLKGRSLERQIPVLLEDPEKMLPMLVSDVPEKAAILMKHFWPGPLTLVLPAASHLPKLLTGNTHAIGVRQSPHPVLRTILRALGEPLTGTSANLSGAAAPFQLEQVSDAILQGADFVIDAGGVLPGRKGSTVLDFTGTEVKILRQGDLPLSRIQEVIAL